MWKQLWQHGRRNRRKIIYDIGFHSGQDTAYYLARGYDVVAIEANPYLVSKGKTAFANEIKSGRLVLLNIGIAVGKGTATFFINSDKSEYSSFDRVIAGRETDKLHEYIISTETLRTIIEKHGVAHYIKIDIEGHDHIAIESLQGMPNCLPKYISIENGQEHGLSILRNLGYVRFAWVNQADVPTMKVPSETIEGDRCDWKFLHGSSGPFGSDLAWQSFEEVLSRSQEYWGNPERDPIKHGWFDVHAALD